MKQKKKFGIAAKQINKQTNNGIGTKAYCSWGISGREFPLDDIIGES